MAGRDSLPPDLLADIKNYLNITWDDEATDKKISGLIASGMAYLNGKLGEEGDYTQDGLPLFQQILLQRATAEGIQTIDLLIKQRILDVAEVTNVQIIQSGVKDRQYQAEVVIETIYGDVQDTIRLEVG